MEYQKVSKKGNLIQKTEPQAISRNWTGTLFSEDLDSYIQKLELCSLYFMCQVERCPTSGKEHLQFFVHFDKNQRLSAVKGILPGAHLQVARNSKSCIEYCSKSESRVRGPYTKGVAPFDRQKLGKKLTVEEARKLNEDELQQLSVYSYVITKKALALIPLEPSMSDTLRGIWYHGPPGCGKSRLVRETYQDLYVKGQNKWFCGYRGQKYILMDDLDVVKGSREAQEIGHLLKITADHYACNGEVKGGIIALCHEKFIITSNYIPEDFWFDSVMVDAVRRRFEFIEMK